MERVLTPSRIRALCTAGLLIWSAAGARAATLTLVPADTSVTLGDHVVLRAVLDSQPDVKGASLQFIWNSARLSFVTAHSGGVMNSGGDFADFVIPDVSVPADSATFDAAVLTGTGQGPGVVAFIEFQATALGIALVDCIGADLRDSQNVATLPPCSSSTIRVLGPVPARQTRWGQLKARYR